MTTSVGKPRRAAHSRRHRRGADVRGFWTPSDRTTRTVDGTSTFERLWLWRTNRSRSDVPARASTTWASRTRPPPSDGHGTLSATSSVLTEPPLHVGGAQAGRTLLVHP